MHLSIILDAPAGLSGTSAFKAFLREADDIAAADPDIVVLGREVDGGLVAPGRLEPVVTLPWLAGRLPDALLIAALPALHSAPFHIARALSAADFLTGGRVGWMPVTTNLKQYDQAYGPSPNPVVADQTGAKYDDFILATQALWDSWDEDALVINKASGVYLDSTKVRRVAYEGPYFSTMGPLNAARPPQGYPVLMRDLDVTDGSRLPCDVGIGRRTVIQSNDAGLRLLKTSAPSIDADVAEVAAGAADGLHLMGTSAVAHLRALRTRFPRRALSTTARLQLNLAKPANRFSGTGGA